MRLLPALAEGETQVADVGRPVRSAIWSGTVRARNGAFSPGPGRMALDDAASGEHHSIEFDEFGRFRAALQPGRYEVRVTSGSWDHALDLEPVTIGELDLELDLVLPGTRLAGVVRERNGQAWSYPRAVVEVRIHREGHVYPSAYRQTDATGDGSFVFDGLEPGTWLLDTRFVRILDNARAELPGPGYRDHRFTVLEGELEVSLELVLEAP